MDKSKKHLAGKRPIVRPGLDHDRTPYERTKPTHWEIMHGHQQAQFGKMSTQRRPRKRGLFSRLP